jgi:long-chain fatty acid transport protein
MSRVGATMTIGAFVAIATLAAPGTAHAAGFAVSEQTATASGTAGAGVAREDDAGLAWYNPAALADAGGWRVGFGLTLARPSVTAQAMDGSWSSDAERAWATPPHLDASFAAGSFALGVAVGVPFGSGVTWPADWPGRHEITRSELQDFRVAPFAAWRFGALRLAAGLHVDAARLRVGRKLDFIDVDGDVAIDMDGRGLGVDASAFWQASADVGVGLVYRGRTKIAFSGGANFTTPDAFSEKTADQEAKADITLPDQLVLGGRWHHGAWAALADVELTTWSSYDTLVIDFHNDVTPDVVQDNGWKTTVAVRGGGELRPIAKLTLRGGAYYDPTPAPDDKLAPSSPDSSRVGVTAGATYALSKAWSVDAFYESMWLLERESSSMEALAARYSGTAQILGFGMRWVMRESPDAPSWIPGQK